MSQVQEQTVGTPRPAGRSAYLKPCCARCAEDAAAYDRVGTDNEEVDQGLGHSSWSILR
jgi:hypothetical protein